MPAIRFVLFEPAGREKRGDEFKAAAEKRIKMLLAQWKTPKTKKSEG
jgi:hypothetical protein